MGSDLKLANKTDYIKKFGSEFSSGKGWKIETDEFTNLREVGGYQTADDVDEDAYPAPIKRVKLAVEKPNTNIEETYYWFLHWLRQERGFTQVEKIYDIFSASENSAVFGNMAQRHAIQQDRAAQFLRGIGEMVKTLFQIVRELRIIDEKIEPYRQWKDKKSADITLKHTFISLVEGGANNPDSVYSLATKVGFTVLPDLFFNTHIYSIDDIDKEVDNGSVKEFNKVVRTVLKRKLYQYVNWKEKTEKELEARKKFQLQYLRQHWSVIQLYMSWVRPYLRTTRRMERSGNLTDNPDIISLFDNTLIEIEILAKRPLSMRKKNDHHSCVLINFKYTTKPTLSYKPEYGQQAVAHSGKVEVTLRAYGWHREDIEAYKKMRREEDVEMLRSINEHIGGAMDYLGKEFEQYLEEAGEEHALEKKKEREKAEKEAADASNEALNKHNRFRKYGLLEPFLEMGAGVGEMFGGIFASSGQKKVKADNSPDPKARDDDKLKEAGKTASFEAGLLYTIYKKTHGQLSW